VHKTGTIGDVLAGDIDDDKDADADAE